MKCSGSDGPGVFVEEGPDRDALTQLLLRRSCLPIYLSREVRWIYITMVTATMCYGHYFTMSRSLSESKLSETQNMGLQWTACKEANELFARVILNAYQPGDAVWCHDYHLMLLPTRLKERVSKHEGWLFPAYSVPLKRDISYVAGARRVATFSAGS